MSSWLPASRDKKTHAKHCVSKSMSGRTIKSSYDSKIISSKERHMTVSLGTASQPVLAHGLQALDGILDKMIAHATAKKIDEAVMLQTRLVPDMFPLVRQVQIVCDFGVKTLARLSGVTAPSHPDTETTFAEIKSRVATARAYVATLDAASIDGRDDIDITFPVGPETMTMKGQPYLTLFALPNFYFHMAMVYAILRHSGVDVGKGDFLGMKRP
jgi:uncharacterized protein